MSELIAIREAARRLGVSDTAVRKAIAAGRVLVAGAHEGNGRPLLSWPECETQWLANSDPTKRSHIGSRGSPRRDSDPPPRLQLPTSGGDEANHVAGDGVITAEGDVAIHDRMSLSEAKTAKEIYNARLARTDYEERSGKLVSVDEVKASAFKVARTVRDGLLNLPDRVSHELAHETDPASVHMRLTDEIRTVLEALATP